MQHLCGFTALLLRDAGRLQAFRQGLREAGYIEGQNVALEYRWAEEKFDRLPAMAAELVRLQVAVIAPAGHVLGTFAAKAATTTVPVVFVTGVDPVALGLVASLSRPGGNLTGIANLGLELEPKRLELLHGAIPAATTIGVLVNRIHPDVEAQSRALEAAARALGLKVHMLHAGTEHDLDIAFARLAVLQASGVVIVTDAFFISQSEQLAALAVRYAMPAIFQYRAFTTAGGLMSYGPDLPGMYRQAGTYVGRILKGEKAGDLPVQQVTKVELIVNLKSARAMGLTIPGALLARVDEVIE
jgi:putative ABC transport system substrate-binding protein